jgi:hypothetical protein
MGEQPRADAPRAADEAQQARDDPRGVDDAGAGAAAAQRQLPDTPDPGRAAVTGADGEEPG